MAISPTDIRILFTNYDIITYFLNMASYSEHFISIKQRILATFNINQKKINSDSLHAFKGAFFFFYLQVQLMQLDCSRFLLKKPLLRN